MFKLENLKKIYPRAENLMFNDSVLFIISDITLLTPVLSDNFSEIGAVIIPRTDINEFRTVFLENYHRKKFRYSTLYHFKLLYRFATFTLTGLPKPVGWDFEMDHMLLKTSLISDYDRKVLMPSAWVSSAVQCAKMYNRKKLMQEDQFCQPTRFAKLKFYN